MTRDEATPSLIRATRTALGEIAEILESYPRAVIAGGTVPYLLIPQEEAPHEGTIDIDIVLDPDQTGADGVYTLHDSLERHLYQQDPRRPFRYTKGFDVDQDACTVLIELLCGGEQRPNGLRLITTEDVYVSIIPGVDVALESPISVLLPDKSDQSISVASIPAFFAMKAAALDRRPEPRKTKDAYDIVYCLRHYPGGVRSIAEAYRPVINHPLISAGVNLLRIHFQSLNSVGPEAYSRQSVDPEDREFLKREAFERVQELLLRLDI